MTSAGSRIRLILGETGSDYLLILNEHDGTQTKSWKGMPSAICKQINNCSGKDRQVKELDCSSSTGAWYVRGVKSDGTGEHSWWGSTKASTNLEEYSSDVKVSFGSKDDYYGDAEEMYVVIEGRNGYSYSNVPDGLSDRVKRINNRRKKIEFIRLFDDGGYFIKDDEGCQWNGLGKFLAEELRTSDYDILDLAVSKDGSWVIIGDDKCVQSRDISKDLDRQLTSFYSRIQTAERKRVAREKAERAKAEREAQEEQERLAREVAERERVEREAQKEREQRIREEAENRKRIEKEQEALRIQTLMAELQKERKEIDSLEQNMQQRKKNVLQEELKIQTLIAELQEERKEIDNLEQQIQQRKKDVLLRLESLPPGREGGLSTGWVSSVPSAQVSDCVICHDNEAVQAIVPCGHHCLCDSCATQIMSHVLKSCPLCREEIQMTIKIYRSV
jgi:hypothetical protein